MNEVKSKHDEVAEIIAKLPLDPEYKHNPNVPIPLGRGVLVKKLEQTSLIKTDTGLLMTIGENSVQPHLGIIQAVGPNCSNHLRVGLRCFYNHYVDSSFYVDGVHYAKMDEPDVYYIIPPKTLVFEGVKDEKEVRREKLFERQVGMTERHHANDQNEKDKKLDKTKGKIRKV